MAGMPAPVEGSRIIGRALLGLATVARQTWSANRMPTSPFSSFPARPDPRRKAEVVFLSLPDRARARILKVLQTEHQIRPVETIEQLRQTLLIKGVDLLILDRSAKPQDDVIQLCRDIRLTSSVAIILMVGSDDPDLRIEALEAGADDCFSRKLGLREIKARVASLLRRAAFGAAALSMGRVLFFEGWSMDPHKRALTDPTGRLVDLTAAEFDLLWAFCRNSGKTLSRQTLLSLTRVGAARPVDRSIDVHINRLRSKIEADPHRPVFLRTVRLGGYIFTPAVEIDLLPKGNRVKKEQGATGVEGNQK